MKAKAKADDSTASQLKQWDEGLHKLGITAAARKLGVSRSTLRDRLRKAGKVAAPEPQERAIGRPLADFRSQHDKNFIVPRKVRAALEALSTGWLYEIEFAKLAGVSLADLGHFRAQFEENIVAIRRDGGKRAWARKDVAAKMREMLS